MERPDEIMFSMLCFFPGAVYCSITASMKRACFIPSQPVPDTALTVGVNMAAVDDVIVTTLFTYSLIPP